MKINSKLNMQLILTIILSASLFWFVGCSKKEASSTQPEQVEAASADVAYYTCPMHPEIHESKVGTCPICNMKLQPVQKEEVEKIQGQEDDDHANHQHEANDADSMD